MKKCFDLKNYPKLNIALINEWYHFQAELVTFRAELVNFTSLLESILLNFSVSFQAGLINFKYLHVRDKLALGRQKNIPHPLVLGKNIFFHSSNWLLPLEQLSAAKKKKLLPHLIIGVTFHLVLSTLSFLFKITIQFHFIIGNPASQNPFFTSYFVKKVLQISKAVCCSNSGVQFSSGRAITIALVPPFENWTILVSRFKCFLTKRQPLFRISNGQASWIQIPFEILTICKPTFFWPLENKTCLDFRSPLHV